MAAATTVGDLGFERSEALMDAGCDCIVIDTAHGHNMDVAAAVKRVKSLSNSVQVIAGNIATAEAAKALIGAPDEVEHATRVRVERSQQRAGKAQRGHLEDAVG